jgi:sugar phosphate permease
MSSVAGAFNGVIAYAIEKNLNGHNGWQAWRWIFLIEGILPIGASVFVFILLPKSPDSAGIGFSDADRVLAVARSKRAHNNLEEKIEFKKIPLVLLSVSFWGFILISCCAHFATSSFSNFLPLIVRVCPHHLNTHEGS